MATLQLAPGDARFAAFEKLYADMRRREGRRPPEGEALRGLPQPPPGASASQAYEWRSRAWCAGFLERRLRQRGSRRLLDLGCGPGWLAARMVRGLGLEAVGLDVGRAELEAGAAAFGDLPALRLVQGDVFDERLELGRFDTVVLLAALQYFPDVARLMARLGALLHPGGEVLVMESPLYRSSELLGARARTRSHYEQLGLPEAAGFYHHHGEDELRALGARWLCRPSSWRSRFERHVLRRVRSPHPRRERPGQAGRLRAAARTSRPRPALARRRGAAGLGMRAWQT